MAQVFRSSELRIERSLGAGSGGGLADSWPGSHVRKISDLMACVTRRALSHASLDWLTALEPLTAVPPRLLGHAPPRHLSLANNSLTSLPSDLVAGQSGLRDHAEFYRECILHANVILISKQVHFIGKTIYKPVEIDHSTCFSLASSSPNVCYLTLLRIC